MDLSLLALGQLGGDSQSLESGKRTLSSSACKSDVAVPMRNTVEVMDYRLERSGVGSDRGPDLGSNLGWIRILRDVFVTRC